MATLTHVDQLDQIEGLEISDEQSGFDYAHTTLSYRGRDFQVSVTRNDEIPTNEPQFFAAISEIMSANETANWDGEDDGHETDEAAFLSAVEAIIETVDDDIAGSR